MAGDIKVNEGKLWMVAGWVFRNVIEDTLPHIPQTESEHLLHAIDAGFGEGKLEYVSLIGVPLGEKRTFLEALERAFREREAKGSGVFSDPSFYPGYMARFRELIEMVAADVSELERQSGGNKGEI
jgi:hypothetical protein